MEFYTNQFFKLEDQQIDSEKNSNFEILLMKISSKFVNLPTDQIDTEIEDAQRLICECLNIDMSTLWQWADGLPHELLLTHVYIPPGGPERPERLDALEHFPWVSEKMRCGQSLAYSNSDLPKEATLDLKSRQFYGAESSVNIPLAIGGESLIGILTFDTLWKTRSWSKAVVQKLHLVAEIFTNVLARKNWEIELCENEARLNLATQAGRIGLWDIDFYSKNIWVTPEFRGMCGFSENEFLDYDRFCNAIHPEDYERFNKAVRKSAKTGGELRCKHRVVLPDGSMRWIDTRGKSVTGSDGKTIRLMGISLDISAHKEMEKQLQTRLAEIQNLKRKLEEENIYLRKKIELRHAHERIVGRSRALKQMLAQVEQVAGTDATVLIEGETGTGKELLARSVHRLSLRKDRPLVTVNCASLPPSLIENELFGREKGAYTSAITKMAGRFEMADGATLFLDEIGELPLETQAKLLRVLEQGQFERLGSTRSIRVDVRIIAATNQDLQQQVTTGKFRKDLYFRLNVFPLHVPALRERTEDIPELVSFFVGAYAMNMGKQIDNISQKCMDMLQDYAWPGNVRELKNMVERAVILCDDNHLSLQHFQDRSPKPEAFREPESPELFNLALMEKRVIVDALKKTEGNKSKASKLLHISRQSLDRRIMKFKLSRLF